MKYFWSDNWPFFAFLGGVVVVVALIFALAIGVDYLDCKGFERGTKYEVQYSWGCYAKLPDGEWVPKAYVFGSAQELRLKGKK